MDLQHSPALSNQNVHTSNSFSLASNNSLNKFLMEDYEDSHSISENYLLEKNDKPTDFLVTK